MSALDELTYKVAMLERELERVTTIEHAWQEYAITLPVADYTASNGFATYWRYRTNVPPDIYAHRHHDARQRHEQRE